LDARTIEEVAVGDDVTRRRVRRALALLVVLTPLGAGTAHAQFEDDRWNVQPGNSGPGQIDRGTTGSVGDTKGTLDPGDVRRQSKPKARRAPRNGRRCTKVGRVRTCTTYRRGRATKICVKRATRKEKCRKPRRRRARSTASIAVAPKYRTVLRSSEGPIATTATVIERGWASTTLPAVGRMWRDGLAHCTATYIGPGIAVTAAHCLWDRSTNRYVHEEANLQFTPGSLYNGQQCVTVGVGQGGCAAGTVSMPNGITKVINAWVPQKYVDGYFPGFNNGRYDYGFVQTQEHLGDKTGYYSIWANLGASANDQYYWIGYSANGNWMTATNVWGNSQFFCKARWDGDYAQQATIVGNGWYLAKAGCPMSGGSSGGPVWKLDANGWFLNGVHNAGLDADEDGFSEQSYHNYLDQEFLDFYAAIFSSGYRTHGIDAGLRPARKVNQAARPWRAMRARRLAPPVP
jgi:hypothetical protein